MPYTKPDRTTRTRMSEPSHVPTLTIVKFFTEPPPMVDATKYRTWAPNLDTPRQQKDGRRGGRPSAAPVDVQVPMAANKPTPAPMLDMPVVAVPVAAVADVERPAPKPAPTPTCLPATPEPMRLHLLDWQRRMGGYEFSSPPAGCLPRKAHKRINTMTRGQLSESLRSHGVTVALAINCAAPGQPPQPTHVETTKKPFKTGQKGKYFAGDKVFDVDAKWRTACAQ